MFVKNLNSLNRTRGMKVMTLYFVLSTTFFIFEGGVTSAFAAKVILRGSFFSLRE